MRRTWRSVPLTFDATDDARTTGDKRQRERHAIQRDGAAGQCADICRDGERVGRHRRDVERQRRTRRQCGTRHDHIGGRVHRAGRFARQHSPASDGDEPCRHHQDRECERSDHERRPVDAVGQCRGGGTGSNSKFSRLHLQRGASGCIGALVAHRRRVSVDMWFGGRERQLHGATDPAESGDRNADGSERRRSVANSFGNDHDHQQFHGADFRAVERAREWVSGDCSDADSGSGFESGARLDVVADRQRLCGRGVRSADGADAAVRRWRSARRTPRPTTRQRTCRIRAR